LTEPYPESGVASGSGVSEVAGVAGDAVENPPGDAVNGGVEKPSGPPPSSGEPSAAGANSSACARRGLVKRDAGNAGSRDAKGG
jgi:hypothetical protein